MTRLPVAARFALAGLITSVALTVALWPRDSGDTAAPGPQAPPTSLVSAEARAEAGLVPCPRPAPGAVASGPLAAITLGCLADGAPVGLAAALGGKPALLNLWAYWCAPCAHELPYLQQYAQRAGNAITVLTVHSDPEEAKGLSRLSALGVTLPGVADPTESVRIAARAPAVLPTSVLVRADGSIAAVVVRTFDDVEDIASTVAARLGVVA